MKLSAIKADPGRLKIEVQKARVAIGQTVRVNNGIRTAEDLSLIINNEIMEQVDWKPLYEYAEKFD